MGKLYHKKPSTHPNTILEGLNLQKLAQIVKYLFLSKGFGFSIVKILDYQAKIVSLIIGFGDLTLVKLCCAV